MEKAVNIKQPISVFNNNSSLGSQDEADIDPSDGDDVESSSG